MKLTISYAELQEYVASHFHKTVNVGHVDGKTVSVSFLTSSLKKHVFYN